MKRNTALFALAAAACLVLAVMALIDPAAGLHFASHGPTVLVGAMAAMPGPAAFANARRVAIPGKRGIQYVRAEATPSAAEIKAAVDAVQKAFADFKAENDAALAAMKKDVVQNEKVDRINAAVDKQQKALDDLSAQLAAAKIGGADDKGPTAEQKAHSKAFNTYFRKGADAGLRELEVKASLSSNSDPDGGYTVSRETETAIDRVLPSVSAMRSIATVRQISGSGYKKPVNLGGSSSGWVGETTTRPETNSPTLSVLDFPVMEIYANPAATQTLLDDSAVDIAAWLAGETGIEFGSQEGVAFISGNGVARPRGLLSYTNVLDASYAWGKIGYVKTGVAANIFDNTNNGGDALITLQETLKSGYQANSRFLMNRMTQAAIRKLKDANDVYLWQPGIAANQPATLFGKAITIDDNMNDIGANLFPIAYGDFARAYLIIDRVGIRVLRDPYTNKPYVMFYTTKRVGGGVQNFEAVKLLKCEA
jgi:HK97 family phage major capsid protein